MKIALIYSLSFVYLLLSLEFETTRATGFFIIVSLALCIWGYVEKKKRLNRREAEVIQYSEELLREIPYTQRVISPDYLRALMISEDTNTLYVANRESQDTEYDIKKYPFFKILESAILEDNVLLSLYPKDGLLGSSVLVREESAEVYDEDSEEDLDEEEDIGEEDEFVTKISLKIVFDDLTKPIVEYIFMEDKDPDSKESDEYREAFELCKEWHQKISVIIKRSEYKKVLVSKWY